MKPLHIYKLGQENLKFPKLCLEKISGVEVRIDVTSRACFTSDSSLIINEHFTELVDSVLKSVSDEVRKDSRYLHGWVKTSWTDEEFRDALFQRETRLPCHKVTKLPEFKIYLYDSTHYGNSTQRIECIREFVDEANWSDCSILFELVPHRVVKSLGDIERIQEMLGGSSVLLKNPDASYTNRRAGKQFQELIEIDKL